MLLISDCKASTLDMTLMDNICKGVAITPLRAIVVNGRLAYHGKPVKQEDQRQVAKLLVAEL